MRLARSDVLLLSPCGHRDAAAAQDLDVADDGTQATVERAEGEILVGEETALLAGLGGESENTTAAQSRDAAAAADLEVVLSGIEGEPHRDLLAIIECFTGGVGGGGGGGAVIAGGGCGVARLGGLGGGVSYVSQCQFAARGG